MKVLIFLLLVNNFEPIYEVLKELESNNTENAIGDSGLAIGILQIHKSVIQDVNRYYGTDYTHKDAFDEVCSEEIFVLYISLGIKLYKKKYNKDPTEEDIVRMWNGGIYSGYRRDSTIKYYKKFLSIINNK